MEKTENLREYLLSYIGIKIKQRREELGLTQGELAESVHLTRAAIANIESGKTQVQLVTLIEMSAILKCSLGFFLPQEYFINEYNINKIDYSSYFNTEMDKNDVKYISDLINDF